MKEPKVLLLETQNQLMDIETPRPNGGLSLLYLAGALRQVGIEPTYLDATVGTEDDALEQTFYNGVRQENGLTRIGMSWERLEKYLGNEQFDIIAINSNFTPQTKMAFSAAAIAKRVNPQTLVIAGGVNARALWQRFFATGDFDLVCTTEGEQVIQEIARRVRSGGGYRNIPGTISWDGHPGFCPPDSSTFAKNLDDLPIPAWDLLPFEKYEQISSPHGVDLTGKHERYAPIMTSRGCPFQCMYCHISRERFGRNEFSGDIGDLRLKSVPRALREIEILKSFGVTKLFFEDDSLLAKKSRVKEIFTALRNMGLTIADVNGVNLVHFFRKTEKGLLPDREYMELLYDAGFRQIVFPVESGSQRVLNKYATGKLVLEKMDVIELVRVAADIGIICPINIMMGFPDETEEEMHYSSELALRLMDTGAAYTTFFIPIPFPGSGLYDYAIRHGHLAPDFNPDSMNWKRPVMQNTTVSPERIEELRDKYWKQVNPPEHVAKRIQESTGARWQSGAPDAGEPENAEPIPAT